MLVFASIVGYGQALRYNAWDGIILTCLLAVGCYPALILTGWIERPKKSLARTAGKIARVLFNL